jgi:hypothetical protein
VKDLLLSVHKPKKPRFCGGTEAGPFHFVKKGVLNERKEIQQMESVGLSKGEVSFPFDMFSIPHPAAQYVNSF